MFVLYSNFYTKQDKKPAYQLSNLVASTITVEAIIVKKDISFYVYEGIIKKYISLKIRIYV